MRITFTILAAGLVASAPALAQDTAVAPKTLSSISVRTVKSGIMTVGGKSFPIFRISGGDIMADVIPSKPGQPMHVGPLRYEPMRIGVDADGLLALNTEVAGLLAGQPKSFDATILYNGRKLTISGARLSYLNLPACNLGKATTDLVGLSLHIEKVKVAVEAEPAQVTPLKLSGCTATLDGIPANGIRTVAPGPNFTFLPKDSSVGEIRDYEFEEDETEKLRVGELSLIENTDAPGLNAWARNDLEKGIGETRALQIVYSTTVGPVIRLSYGKALARRATLDLNAANRVTVATENPAITKP